MLRQSWTGGRTVSSICSNRTAFNILKAWSCMELTVQCTVKILKTQKRNFENICKKKRKIMGSREKNAASLIRCKQFGC